MKWWLFGLVTVAAIIFGGSTRVDALALQLQPLDIKTTLNKGETQKGFLDIANSGGETVKVKTSVQSFRQVDNKGNLQFYSDDKVSAGIALDESEITLGPREVFRMYYALTGAKLPEGDVSAAIFFTTETGEVNGVTPAIRVGTLFHITNGQSGGRQAEITGLSVPFLQLNGKIVGDYTVKNTSDPSKGGGLFPDVDVKVAPFDQKQTETSSLVFPGIERNNQFTLSTNRFGFYYVQAQYGNSTRGVWVFVASLWHLVVIAAAVLAALGYVFRRRLRKIFHNNRK